jgi:RsiW-degrading membrane proteinase PrsW (M82 family)
MNLILAVVVGIGLPLVFLALVWARDLYASGSFGNVLAAFAGGLAAFGGAYVVNTWIARRIGFAAVTTTTAPIIEEVLKSLVLLYLVRSPSFTYFVDGAIYGFAGGTAFAVLENPFYAMNTPNSGVALMLMRAFSTSLMHGTATALVGISLGRFKFERGGARGIALLLGWVFAIVLHASFNRAVYSGVGGALLPLGVGIGGVVLVVAFILWGLREERQWLQEILDSKRGLKVGVSSGEAAIVLRLEDLDELVTPIAQHFGEDKRDDVESFLRLQAQLGIKSKTLSKMPDEQSRQEVAAQIADLRKQMDILRRKVGVYCMSYVRSILPPEGSLVWDRLGEQLAQQRVTDKNLWGDLGAKMSQEPTQGSLFKKFVDQ